jgi:hypothetical protein
LVNGLRSQHCWWVVRTLGSYKSHSANFC